MLASTFDLLQQAAQGHYALGAFNVYNLEGALAVVNAAQATRSPAILQIHPSAFEYGGAALVALCLQSARDARVPMSVHLDHSTSADAIRFALDAGMTSIMADGSHLAYDANVAFTRAMVELTRARAGFVEAELGRLAGTEDGLTVAEYEAKLTDPGQAREFVAQTGIDALAVCIGNVHGNYRGEPRLDCARLAAIRDVVSVPLVLHGASGLSRDLVRRSIELGARKFNVNTEVRGAYIAALKQKFELPKTPDLIDLMRDAIQAMQTVVAEKLELFDSIGKA
jgi:tagatose 1,6-diphosphate aldolase GatY/KbaY